MRPEAAVALSLAAQFDSPANWTALVRLALEYGYEDRVARAELNEARYMTVEQFLLGDRAPADLVALALDVRKDAVDFSALAGVIGVLAAGALPDLDDADWRGRPAADVTEVIVRQVAAGIAPYLADRLVADVGDLQRRGVIRYVPPEDRP